jgi:protein phosphatase
VTRLSIRAAGDSHRGHVREHNEDALIVDPRVGLYAVLDGMGGANAGDVASRKARDVIHEYVRAGRATMAARPLLQAAIGAASSAVHGEAQRRRDRHGMGTTVVACLIEGARATVAHVGDSRAYLRRDGRLHRLTQDHTVVAELVARGALSPDDAERHAYKNVLSRNLGAKASAQIDVAEVDLQAGDRLILCSDGLHGYAPGEALQHVAASTDRADEVVRDLLEAALRGGGGDNVTAIVIDAGVAAVPRATMVLRTTGAGTWWARRDRFLAAARTHGVHRSPLCAALSADEAIALVAGNFADAIYHDLEKATGVNVWSFAEDLARGWLGQGGVWGALRELLDALARAVDAVIGELRRDDARLAGLLEVAVSRALVTAETAVGGVLAERLRAIESELARQESDRRRGRRGARGARGGSSPTVRFEGEATVPYLRAQPVQEAAAPEVTAVLDAARRRALARPAGAGDRSLLARVIDHAHRTAAADAQGDPALAARELWDVRTLDEAGVTPLFDALDHGRREHLAAAHAVPAAAAARVRAMRRLIGAYQQIATGVAALVIESVGPAAANLHDVARETARLREQVAAGEARIASLESRFATIYDADLPARIGVDAAGGDPSPAPRGGRRPGKESRR